MAVLRALYVTCGGGLACGWRGELRIWPRLGWNWSHQPPHRNPAHQRWTRVCIEASGGAGAVAAWARLRLGGVLVIGGVLAGGTGRGWRQGGDAERHKGVKTSLCLCVCVHALVVELLRPG